MNNRRILLAVSLFTSTAAAAADAPRPNIVVILVDDLRIGALGCEGHPFVKTPNIDRIAREGARSRYAFVTTPLCSPSRASFLTGLYVHNHQVTNNGNHNALSHQLVTFPRLLHDAGYQTAYIGKWHMGNDDAPRPGFDKWVSFKGQGTYKDPPLNIDGQVQTVPGYITDLLNDEAVRFLRQPRSQPFLLYLAHKAVHGPFTPAERHEHLYTDAPIPRAPSTSDTLEGKPVLTRKLETKAAAKPAKKKAAKTAGGGQNLIRNQLRCLAAIDDGVGQILQALAETKQLENTLLIFTSDNGYFWGEHGLGDKRAAYEESIRVPFLVRYPPLVRPGTVIEQNVLNIDLAPTALALAGIAPPARLDGRSLLPLLKGETANWRKVFLTEYFLEPQYPRIPSWQAVRTDRWKYIHFTDLEGMDELYDLENDPYELKNLINEPSAGERLVMLKQQLAALIASER